MAMKFKMLPRPSQQKTEIKRHKPGIRFHDLVWRFEEERTIISISASHADVTVETGDITVKKKDHIQQRLQGCIMIAQSVAEKKLRKRLKEKKKDE